jgi:hypothetical protein
LHSGFVEQKVNGLVQTIVKKRRLEDQSPAFHDKCRMRQNGTKLPPERSIAGEDTKFSSNRISFP